MLDKLKIHSEVKYNLAFYALFLAIALAGIIYGTEIREQFTFLRVWEVQNILILLIGIPFLFIQGKAGIPDFVDRKVSGKQRFLEPALIGAVFGLLDVIVIKCMMHPEPYNELPPFLQPFPYSVFLYFSGAFEIEVFYRLIPLTILLILGKTIMKGKYFKVFLWVGIIATSLREPLEQWPEGSAAFIAYALLTGFLMNSFQAIYFHKAGFLATLVLRLGHYLFWHILLGVYVEYFELNRFGAF